jgi:hypothetical protein
MAQVIELFGAPGAGKTSVAQALDGLRLDGRVLVAAQRLTRVPRRGGALPPRPARRAPNGPLLRPLDRLLRRDLTPAERRAALASCPEELRAIARRLADEPTAGAGDDAADPVLRLQRSEIALTALLHRTLAAAAADDLIVVLDEGLMQRIRLAHGAATDDAVLRDFVTELPATLLHVHLHVDPDVAAARLDSRARVTGRHAALDTAGRAASVADDAALYARVAAILREQSPTRVLDVDTGDASPDATAGRIVAALAPPRVR